MAYRITKEHVWMGEIPDEPHGLARMLRALSEGGLNLELILSRREANGTALLFVAPLRTTREIETAESIGLAHAGSLRALRVFGPNAVGLGAMISTTVADAGINMRGYSAHALADQQVTMISFDSDEECEAARLAIETVLGAAR